jgi:hypothetical protein
MPQIKDLVDIFNIDVYLTTGMSSESIKARLAQLLRKSQKAVALYTQSDAAAERKSSAAQVRVWRGVNQELADALVIALSKKSTRLVIKNAYVHRDRLYGEWRRYQSELYVKREQLIQAAEDEHFARAAALADRLISVKARMQATRAALHELSIALADTAYKESSMQESNQKSSSDFAIKDYDLNRLSKAVRESSEVNDTLFFEQQVMAGMSAAKMVEHVLKKGSQDTSSATDKSSNVFHFQPKRLNRG